MALGPEVGHVEAPGPGDSVLPQVLVPAGGLGADVGHAAFPGPGDGAPPQVHAQSAGLGDNESQQVWE